MMRHVLLLCLLCFFAQPSLQDGNADLDEVIDEIISLMSEETDGISTDDKYTYSVDPDLFVPPSTTCQQSLEADAMKDVNGLYEYNPFEVWEAKTNILEKELNTMKGAALSNYFLQAVGESSGDRLNYHIGLDDSSASLLFYDVPFPSYTEAYPALFSISVANDFCGSAPTDDSQVDVLYTLHIEKHSCPDPEVQITKEMFLNLAENSTACRAFQGSTCDCYEPDIVTSTSGFSEIGQYGKPTVQRPDVTAEGWFTKLQPHYQMLMEMYTSYDIIVSQIHQSLEAVSAAPFCCFNDIWYQYGDIIPVPDDLCLHCVCNEHWTGTDNCTTITCPLDDYVAVTGDTSVELIAVPDSCCGLPKSIVIGDLCVGNVACEPGGVCVSSPGDFNCSCNAEYQATVDGKGCEDVNECDIEPPVCGPGNCTNTEGGFTCTCNEGFTLAGRKRDTSSACIDIDECVNASVCTNGTCVNTIGGYSCDCDDGFAPGGPLGCQDVDECVNASVCTNGTCINSIGGYSCDCDDGFAPGGPLGCQDINECLDDGIDTSSCEEGKGNCTNREGAPWICTCVAGYEHGENNHTCVDVNECLDDGIDTSSCDPAKGNCTNNEGAPWNCTCKAGYANLPDNDQICGDIDECATGDTTNCVSGTGECVNTESDWYCNCTDGYKNPEADNHTCTDHDDCSDENIDTSGCVNGVCTNHVGSTWTCECDDGYENAGNDQECTDINECTATTQRRSVSDCETGGGTCVNNDGAPWTCSCGDGFKNADDNDQICVDIDECVDDAVDKSSCEAGKGNCTNNIGSPWTCTCADGYENPVDDSQSCVDIDECTDPSVNKSSCEALGGSCVNIEGLPWTCDCGPDFQNVEGNEQECEDFNECEDDAIDKSSCEVGKGVCANNFGAPWICNCTDGYENDPGDPQTCIDIDECTASRTSRSVEDCETAGGTCWNVEGAPWKCNCSAGFKNPDDNEQACEDVNECIDDAVDKSSCEAGKGSCTNNPGEPWSCNCTEGYMNDPGDNQTCIDINECTDPDVDTSSCQSGFGNCVNVDGNWDCSCLPGFQLDPLDPEGHTCIDIDECTSPTADTSSCLPGFGNCTNEVGGWSCSCLSGFESDTLDAESRTCIDINECLLDDSKCKPNGTCVNTNGSYQCDCDEFFVATENDTCVDLDMCIDPIATCGDNPEILCIDGPEDCYVCQCPANQTFDLTLKDCIDDPVLDPVVIQRTYTIQNETEEFFLQDNTVLELKTDVAGCFMYFEITFPDLDLTHWHPNTNTCIPEGTVRQTPYLSVHDEYLHRVNDIRYCHGENITIRSYFNVIKIRSASAGQSKLEFPVSVKLYKGEGACCGGILTPVQEDQNPFNQIEITSANYPLPYDNNQWCSWVINRPNGTTGGKIVAYIIDFTVVVTVENQEDLDCSVEDALYISNTRSMEEAVPMCWESPEWGNFYEPDLAFVHWQTNEDRVTRGFQMMYFFTNNEFGLTTFERNLPVVCGLVLTGDAARARREDEEYDEDEYLDEDENTDIHVPLSLRLPKRVKRVSSRGGSDAKLGELPFLVAIVILHKKDLQGYPLKTFFGVLIAENFVVTTSQAKAYQEADTKNRKIKLKFGMYDISKMVADDKDKEEWVLTKSALRVFKHPECLRSLEGEPYPVEEGKTSWEYTKSVIGGCPMLMVTGELPTNDYIQPAMFPWYTFPWRSNNKKVQKEAKRLFHTGWDSNPSGNETILDVTNTPKKVSMQKADDTKCLKPLNEQTMAPQRLCALATGGKGPTQGDIGGPVLKRMNTDNPAFTEVERHWVVIGILVKAQIGSSVPNNGDKIITYQAYIEVNSYLYWMQATMESRKLTNCRRPMTDVALASGP